MAQKAQHGDKPRVDQLSRAMGVEIVDRLIGPTRLTASWKLDWSVAVKPRSDLVPRHASKTDRTTKKQSKKGHSQPLQLQSLVGGARKRFGSVDRDGLDTSNLVFGCLLLLAK